MQKSEFSEHAKRELNRLMEEDAIRHHKDDLEANRNRARAITVGTCFGGISELMMRGGDGRVLYAQLTPSESIEFLHQIASSIGCHISIKPREDFASWRVWKNTPDQIAHANGHAPWPNLEDETFGAGPTQANIGTTQTLPVPEKQELLDRTPDQGEKDEVMAIKENIDQ